MLAVDLKLKSKLYKSHLLGSKMSKIAFAKFYKSYLLLLTKTVFLNLTSVAITSGKALSFAPQNKVSVKFCDDIARPEGAVDLGGPKREFFTLVLEWIVNSQIFSGTEKNKFLSCNATCHLNDYYFYARQIIALSMVHGGPAIRCFSPALYHFLVHSVCSASVDISNVYDPELRNYLLALINCQSVSNAQA